MNQPQPPHLHHLHHTSNCRKALHEARHLLAQTQVGGRHGARHTPPLQPLCCLLHAGGAPLQSSNPCRLVWAACSQQTLSSSLKLPQGLRVSYASWAPASLAGDSTLPSRCHALLTRQEQAPTERNCVGPGTPHPPAPPSPHPPTRPPGSCWYCRRTASSGSTWWLSRSRVCCRNCAYLAAGSVPGGGTTRCRRNRPNRAHTRPRATSPAPARQAANNMASNGLMCLAQ